MKAWTIALAALCLAGCTAEGPLRDQVGHLYPKECQGDLSWMDVGEIEAVLQGQGLRVRR